MTITVGTTQIAVGGATVAYVRDRQEKERSWEGEDEGKN